MALVARHLLVRRNYTVLTCNYALLTGDEPRGRRLKPSTLVTNQYRALVLRNYTVLTRNDRVGVVPARRGCVSARRCGLGLAPVWPRCGPGVASVWPRPPGQCQAPQRAGWFATANRLTCAQRRRTLRALFDVALHTYDSA